MHHVCALAMIYIWKFSKFKNLTTIHKDKWFLMYTTHPCILKFLLKPHLTFSFKSNHQKIKITKLTRHSFLGDSFEVFPPLIKIESGSNLLTKTFAFYSSHLFTNNVI